MNALTDTAQGFDHNANQINILFIENLNDVLIDDQYLGMCGVSLCCTFVVSLHVSCSSALLVARVVVYRVPM